MGELRRGDSVAVEFDNHASRQQSLADQELFECAGETDLHRVAVCNDLFGVRFHSSVCGLCARSSLKE